jgi:hypothetical protein
MLRAGIFKGKAHDGGLGAMMPVVNNLLRIPAPADTQFYVCFGMVIGR